MSDGQVKRRLHNKQSESESEVRRIQNLVDCVIAQRIGDLPSTIKKMQEEINELRSLTNRLSESNSRLMNGLCKVAVTGESVASDRDSTPSERLDLLCNELALVLGAIPAWGRRPSAMAVEGGAFNPERHQRLIYGIETPRAVSVYIGDEAVGTVDAVDLSTDGDPPTICRVHSPSTVRLYNQDDDTPQISFPPFDVRIRQDDDDIPSSLLDE